MKICACCKELKPYEAFHRDKNNPTGRATYCRKCCSEKSKLRYVDRVAANKRNQVYYYGTSAISYRADPRKWLFNAAKKRAKKRGLEFSITLDDIVFPQTCPIFNTPLDILIQDRKASYLNAASLDRIDNSKGYIKGNVSVISRKANRVKSDLSVDQIKSLLQYMTRESDQNVL